MGFGVGVWAMGGRAPIFLKPSSKKGPPTSGKHERGELMVDRKGGSLPLQETGPCHAARPFGPLRQRPRSSVTKI